MANYSYNSPGTYTLTLQPGSYRIVLAGAGGGGVYGSYKGVGYSYAGGGGAVITKDVELSAAAVLNLTIGKAGTDGSVSGTYWEYYYPDGVTVQKTGGTGMITTAAVSGGSSSISGGVSVTAYGGGSASTASNGASYGANRGNGYCTVTALNNPPTTPENVQVTTPMSGRSATVTWNASTDPDGHAITYVVEGRTDSGTYVTLGTTTDTKLTVTVPASGVTYQVRVKAVDTASAESGYAVGAARTIIYNYPPVVSGTDQNKGEISQPFAYAFTVDDSDVADVLTVRMLLDGTEIGRIDNAVRKQSYSVDLTGCWLYMGNGMHTLSIAANDDKGGSAARKVSFSRVTPGLHLELLEALQPRGGGVVRTLQAIFYYDAPASAAVEIWVSNDSGGTWHDFTPYDGLAEVFEFPGEPGEGEAGFLAQIKITKPAGYTGTLLFTGATFMLNANGSESEKWLSNVYTTKAFTGNLAGVQSGQEGFDVIDRLALSPQILPLGLYATLAALQAAHPTGSAGDTYLVGTSASNVAYIWDTGQRSWVNAGALSGIAGKNGVDGKDGASGQDGKDGVDGKDGKDGAGLVILGRYATLAELEAAQPMGGPGDSWAVGVSAPYEFYQYDAETTGWFSIGTLQGPQGDAGPGVSEVAALEERMDSLETAQKSISAGTEDLEAGVSVLETGAVYFVYE